MFPDDPVRAEWPWPGTVKIVGFRGKLGLSKRRNVLRYSPTWKDPYFTDGAAHGRSLGGKAVRNHLVSQPLAGTRAGVREKPRSLEGEVEDVAGAAQGFPHRSAGSASFARSVASQGGGPGTGNQPTACPVAAASRAVPRAEPAVTTGPDPAFELIPPRHQFGLVQVLLMLGWVLRGGRCEERAALWIGCTKWMWSGDSTFLFHIARPCDCGCCVWGTTNCN